MIPRKTIALKADFPSWILPNCKLMGQLEGARELQYRALKDFAYVVVGLRPTLYEPQEISRNVHIGLRCHDLGDSNFWVRPNAPAQQSGRKAAGCRA
jgi:hypothetical protein